MLHIYSNCQFIDSKEMGGGGVLCDSNWTTALPEESLTEYTSSFSHNKKAKVNTSQNSNGLQSFI